MCLIYFFAELTITQQQVSIALTVSKELSSQYDGLIYLIGQAITTVIVHLSFIYRLFRCTWFFVSLSLK